MLFSFDEYIFKDKCTTKRSIHRQVDTLLDGLNGREFIVVEGTAKEVYQAWEFSDK